MVTGDCLAEMAKMEASSIDVICCDPPYGLEFMGKEWDKLDVGLPQEAVWKGRRGKGGGGFASKPTVAFSGDVRGPSFGGKRSGFKRCTVCGKRQFSGSPCKCEAPVWVLEYPEGPPSSSIRMQRWHEQWAVEALRVAKPGAHLLAFGGTRTFHRLTCAIEDAGWEIRDSIGWNHLEPVFCRCDALPYTRGIQSQDVRRVWQGMDAEDAVSGDPEPVLLDGVLAQGSPLSAQESDTGVEVSDLRQEIPPRTVAPAAERQGILLGVVPEQDVRGEVPQDRGERALGLVAGERGRVLGEDARSVEPRMEGRGDVLPQARQLRADQVRPSAGVGEADGASGRLCDGTPASDGDALWISVDANRRCPSRGPQSHEERPEQPSPLAVEWIAQGGGAWPGCPRCGKPLAPPFFAGPLAWNYGSGFPKSLNLAVAFDKQTGMAARGVGFTTAGYTPSATVPGGAHPAHKPTSELGKQWQGWGTALKPAFEPIILARKPLIGTVAANVAAHGTGALNIDGCRIEGDEDGSRNRPPSRLGSETTYAQDEWTRTAVVRRQDTTGLGRWPANLVLDEESAALLDEQSGLRDSCGSTRMTRGRITGKGLGYGSSSAQDSVTLPDRTDEIGGASRFFYCAKSSRAEREAGLNEDEATRLPIGRVKMNNGNDAEGDPVSDRFTKRARNHHPTVKPVALMRWLVRLVTPPGGLALDPFAGSGTTGVACVLEGRAFLGIELDAGYADIARRRIASAEAQGNLFGEVA